MENAKNIIRKNILDKRKAVPSTTANEAAEKLCQNFLEFEKFFLPNKEGFSHKWSGKIIASYWPINSEIDPRPLMFYIKKNGGDLALPRIEQNDQKSMSFRQFFYEEKLEITKFQTKSPPQNAPILIPDLILLPLVAFDNNGTRLGYGKGYYDKTLQEIKKLNPKAYFLGLAFALQEVKFIPSEKHDVKLHALITEKKVMFF